MEHIALEERLTTGALDEQLIRLYGPGRLAEEKERYAYVLARFDDTFRRPAAAFFSAPGRTELGGNHTDHQHGRVLAAGVDRDILAAVSKTDSGMLRVQSEVREGKPSTGFAVWGRLFRKAAARSAHMERFKDKALTRSMIWSGIEPSHIMR